MNQLQTRRQVAISVQDQGIAVGVYTDEGAHRISGTTFTTWAAVIGLLAKMDRLGYVLTVSVRADVAEGFTCNGEVVYGERD